MPISQYTALFALLGTNYGGDGITNFALPNLQGRVSVGQDQGAGLSIYDLGQAGGSATVTLLAAQNPAHSHSLNADKETATSASPANGLYMKGHYSAGATGGPVQAYSSQSPNATMNAGALSPAGGNLPHNNMMPYLALNFCIAVFGVFPPRS